VSEYCRITHQESGQALVERARWCNSFLSKLRGFTFRRRLRANDGLVLVEKSDSRTTTAIHMFFVFFDLGVVWVNDAGEVVDTVLARAWRPFYAPKRPARYVVECHPALLAQVKVGDYVHFHPLNGRS
jgi:uncharacterized protein